MGVIPFNGFDSLNYFEKLKNAGFSEEQAKAQVEAMREVVDAWDAAAKKGLATNAGASRLKSDLQTLRLELASAKNEITLWFLVALMAQTGLIMGMMAWMK